MSFSTDFRQIYTFNYKGEPDLSDDQVSNNNAMKLAMIIPVIGTVVALILFRTMLKKQHIPHGRSDWMLVARCAMALVPGVNTLLLGFIDGVGTLVKLVVDAREKKKSLLKDSSAAMV